MMNEELAEALTIEADRIKSFIKGDVKIAIILWNEKDTEQEMIFGDISDLAPIFAVLERSKSREEIFNG